MAEAVYPGGPRWRPFYQHQWLDVRDTVNQWLEAQVLHVQPDTGELRLHYRGWAAKFDETLDPKRPEHLARLAPLHTHTAPRPQEQEPGHGRLRAADLTSGARLDAQDSIRKWYTAVILEHRVHSPDALGAVAAETDADDERKEDDVVGDGEKVAAADASNEEQQQREKEAWDGGMVLIKYEGWDDRYNEWINTDSYRLAPLHSYTQPPVAVPVLTDKIQAPGPRQAPLQPQREQQRQQQQQQHQQQQHGRRFEQYRRPQGPGAAPRAAPSNQQEQRFGELLARRRGWRIVPMGGDGNCLFRSVSHQVYGTQDYHALVRQKCMDYVLSERNFFQRFVRGDFEQYVQQKRQLGCWGDHVEIQAMSEIYDRPIEVYAYGDQPLETYKGAPRHNEPMRLSYHFNSHYNSIVDPAKHPQQIIGQRNGLYGGGDALSPGDIEELQIEESKKRGGRRLTGGFAEGDAEDEELMLALALSREQFANGNNNDDLDEAILRSLQQLDGSEPADMADLDRAMLASLADAGDPEAAAVALAMGGAGDADDDQLKQALQQSLLDLGGVLPPPSELDQAIQASLLSPQPPEHPLPPEQRPLDSRPAAVQTCVGMGFSREAVERAFQLLADPRDSQDQLVGNMLEYLAS